MELLTISQAAYKLHCCELTIKRLIKSGKLDVIEISPRRRLISEQALDAFIESKIIREPKKVVDVKPRVVTKSVKTSSLAIEDAGEGRKIGNKSHQHWRREIDRLCQ
jgi:excisionase family DNA binding protein